MRRASQAAFQLSRTLENRGSSREIGLTIFVHICDVFMALLHLLQWDQRYSTPICSSILFIVPIGMFLSDEAPSRGLLHGKIFAAANSAIGRNCEVSL
jgi:hypothetical protein